MSSGRSTQGDGEDKSKLVLPPAIWIKNNTNSGSSNQGEEEEDLDPSEIRNPELRNQYLRVPGQDDTMFPPGSPTYEQQMVQDYNFEPDKSTKRVNTPALVAPPDKRFKRSSNTPTQQGEQYPPGEMVPSRTRPAPTPTTYNTDSVPSQQDDTTLPSSSEPTKPKMFCQFIVPEETNSKGELTLAHRCSRKAIGKAGYCTKAGHHSQEYTIKKLRKGKCTHLSDAKQRCPNPIGDSNDNLCPYHHEIEKGTRKGWCIHRCEIGNRCHTQISSTSDHFCTFHDKTAIQDQN
ncbi:hypothetical protein DSL72_006266 [Monilinia vaccinii-corymbosi]|uniref:Uncharacterized protein n=1 Tax=Monilinia vaccinii-corymbosi TaxID=61207 RepID=A0A8A3PMM6_9HELO|nr:hypothetical protein DSL72_006266 [Monilinia vaccinii-corymbosi]